MTLHNLSAPVPTKVARALVFVGNLLHTIGTNLLSVANEELTDELGKARATIEWLSKVNDDLHRAATAPDAVDVDVDEHQGAAAFAEYVQQGYAPCRCGHGSKMHTCRGGQTPCEWCGCPRVYEHQGAEHQGAEHQGAEHQGAELVDASPPAALRVDDGQPEWLGFGGFPANQSGGRL